MFPSGDLRLTQKIKAEEVEFDRNRISALRLELEASLTSFLYNKEQHACGMFKTAAIDESPDTGSRFSSSPF